MRGWAFAILAIAVFGVAPAFATQTYLPVPLTPEEVLAKAAAARGKLEPGAYRRAYLKTRGASSISIDLYEAGHDYVETHREGDYTWSDGSQNGTQWQRDENGVVTRVSGYADTADPFLTALDQPETHDSAMRVLGATTAQPACIVLQLAPGPGLLQKRYYDAKSFLLRRVVTTDYQGQPWTYEYSRFTTRYGVTLPQRIAYSDGHPENASLTQLTAFEPVPYSSVHAAVPRTVPLFSLPPNGPVSVPAEFTPNGIIVRVSIQGRGLDFELDSGSSTIVIDSTVARQLGLNVTDVQKGSFSGEYTIGRTRAPDFDIGTLQARNVTMDAIPFERMVGERKVVGLLGGDFFASERVAVNFQHQTLAIAPSSNAAPPGAWNAVPIAVDDMVPRAHAKFNAVDGAFIVDLGADDTLLYPHFFRRFHPKNKGEVLGQMEGIAGQGVDYRQYTFSRFDLGDMAFADVSADVTAGTQFEDLDYDGLLGRNVLSNFNLLFDYPAGKLYLKSLVQ